MATQRARGRCIVAAGPAAGRAALGAAASGSPGSGLSTGALVGTAGGVLEQATKVVASATAEIPRMAPARRLAPWKAIVMWVILLEALGALALLGLIVWWTMFAGRKRGERRDED